MTADSTRKTQLKKPHRDFPLFPHQRGYWAKKVRGKLHYFGKIADDPSGQAALALWLEQRDDLLAGRTPRSTPDDGLTLATLCNRFLTAKEQQRDAGDIKARTFDEYHANCKFVVNLFGKNRLVDDLAAEDFQALRAQLAKRFGVYKLAKEVQLTRSIFKFGVDAGLIEKQVRFGPTFRKPPARLMRAHKQKQDPKMFEAPALQCIIAHADQPLQAMILLGINCGFGNADCGTLPLRALNLKAGWVNFPRPKTAIERRCPLWPETIEALQDWLLQRPTAKLKEHDGLVFITKYGGPWAKDTSDSPVAKEFRKLLDMLDAAAKKEAAERHEKPPAKIHRHGLGFYALRHTFETVAGGSKDQVAVNHIMGHVDSSMAAHYRESIDDERLIAVSDHVRRWLFMPKRPK